MSPLLLLGSFFVQRALESDPWVSPQSWVFYFVDKHELKQAARHPVHQLRAGCINVINFGFKEALF